MTSAAAIDDSAHCPAVRFTSVRRPRPHGMELLAARLGMTLVLWARRRSERADLGYERHTIRQRESQAREQRENEARMLAYLR
jgi:hypothetical protein